MANWLNKKVVEPLLEILRKGAEPKLLAFSTALGFTIGLFPICGTTVIMAGVAIAALRSRCHGPTVMLMNFVATPLELSLIVPFLRLGEFVTGGPHFPLTSDAFKKVITLQASREVLVLVRKFSASPSSPKRPVSPSDVKLKDDRKQM